jgi:hypothetical protein
LPNVKTTQHCSVGVNGTNEQLPAGPAEFVFIGQGNQSARITDLETGLLSAGGFHAENNAHPSDALADVLLQDNDYIALIYECPRTVRLTERAKDPN